MSVFVDGAEAASFDCAKARTPIERTICNDPEASKADEAMSRAYRTAVAAVSSEGAKALRASQRSFLIYMRRMCALDRPRPDGKTWDETTSVGDCVRAQLDARTFDLQQAVKVLGGRKFITTTA